MCASLAPERLDALSSYSVFGSLSNIERCWMNLNIPAPKIGAIQMATKTQNDDFMFKKKDLTILIKFQ
jgi:hypothetical protein